MTELEQQEAPFSDDQIALASSNYEAQEWLVRELHRAFKMSQLTLAELAQELELSEEEAQAWIDGDVDLRLSDLRHFANAIDAHVTYRVAAVKTKYIERFSGMTGAGMWQESHSQLWKSEAPTLAKV